MTQSTGPLSGLVQAIVEQAKGAVGKPVAPSRYGFKSFTFVTPTQLADHLQMSLKTLERMRADGSGPPFVKITNNRIRYPVTTLDSWITKQLDDSDGITTEDIGDAPTPSNKA